MSEGKSIFEVLNSIDVSGKVKEKNKLSYLPWASAWSEVKKVYPEASFEIKKQQMENGIERPWLDDGKSGWVEVSVTINGQTITEMLAIMNFSNKAIPADQITATDANKSIKRCLTKAIAMHGLGLYVYEGEDVPEDTAKTIEIKSVIKDIVAKKCTTEKGRAKVGELCKEAEKKAFPVISDEDIRGDYTKIEDLEILQTLKTQLMAVRTK